MSGTTIKIRSLLAAVILMLTAGTLAGQSGSRSLKLIVGTGYGHYFNTFTNVQDEDIMNNRLCISARLMWQPEHLVGIGFESGYYQFYSTTRIETGTSSQKLTTSMNVVPLFLCLSMKATPHFRVNIGTGGALMNYRIQTNKSAKGVMTGQVLSMADFTAGCSWFIPAGKRFEFGTEFKYIYIGKTSDHHVSAMLTVAYSIINRELTKQ